MWVRIGLDRVVNSDMICSVQQSGSDLLLQFPDGGFATAMNMTLSGWLEHVNQDLYR